MPKSFPALLSALLLPLPGFACTCMWGGPLLKVGPHAEVVVRGKVLRHVERGNGVNLAMEVEVYEVLKGRLETRTVKIWGDNGAQCSPYVKSFTVGTEWIFAIARRTGATDYRISVCGEYWAKVNGETVTGRLNSPTPPGETDAPERMSLREVREKLRVR